MHIFMSVRANNYIANSNLGKMSRLECMAIKKTLVSIELQQMREFYERIPKEQQAEDL